MKNLVRKLYRRIVKREKIKNKLNIADIEKFREFDQYELDIVICKRKSIHIESKLPSEPPEGITYEFGPSGYTGEIASDYCVIPTTYRNVNNYCHWSFSELPFLFLAFESNTRNIVLPDSIIDAKLPFQRRWMEILYTMHPEKNIMRISNTNFPENSLIPVNHDTSLSKKPIGKTQYKWYHRSRATPYLINRIEQVYQCQFNSINKGTEIPYVYINRRTRRLKNEIETQNLLVALGFEIINLEDLSLDEQVCIFAKAKLIVGFHGAGLANLIYANKSTKVLEIVDKNCVYPCYLDGIVIPGSKATRTHFHMLCEMKGLEYYSIESKDFELDLKNLKGILIRAMKKQNELLHHA